MSPDQLTTNVCKRICEHMNNDHQKALIDYALFYAGLEKANKAKMKDITPTAMELEVDEVLVSIPFYHTLKDSEDAHRTLVDMLKKLPKNISDH